MSSNTGVVALASGGDSLVEERHAISFHGQCDGPVLNPDVIFYILSFLQKTDLLAAMLTCRSMHSAGMKRLLQIATDFSLDCAQLKPFITFMSNNPRHFRHLRKLNIRLDDPSLARMAAQMISQCHWLEDISMLFLGRAFVDVPELDGAISSLPRLGGLWITGDVATDRFAKCMARMKCPLRRLGARFNGRTYQGAATALQSLSEYLQVIYVRGLSFRNVGPRLPRVYRAGAMFSDFDYDTRTLLYWFPAMKDLEFLRPPGFDVAPPEFPVWDEARRRNESRRSTSQWPQPLSIHGHFLSIYSSAPTCEVYYLRCDDATIYQAERLPIVLADLRPRMLNLHIVLKSQQCHLLYRILPQASSVIQFIIRIEFDPYTTNMAEELIDHLPRALEPLRTQAITVAFALHGFVEALDNFLHPEYQESEELHDGELEYIEMARTLQMLDARYLAQRIAEQVPSLLLIIIQLPGTESIPAWTVRRHECGELSLVPCLQPIRRAV